MIGITFTETSFDYYITWLEHFGVAHSVLDYKEKDVFGKFDNCKGLILTGGVDIYPELYNDWENKEDTGKFNPERDGFELKLLGRAVEKGIPVLGICRGCQLINVFFKGSLIYDLESIRNVNHRKMSEGIMRMHDVKISDNSHLLRLIGKNEGTVTSSHHQAVDRPGEGLRVCAKAPDGVIEGVEHESGKIIGVQWHPERFADYETVFSKNLIKRFAEMTE